MLKLKHTFLASIIGLLLFASPLSLLAQQKRPAATRKPPGATQVAEPVLTFDTLLADDNYRVYSEVRNVGSLVRSQGFNDLLDPLVKLAAPPKQFSTVLNWVKAHAEPLAGSRLCIAGWPSRNTIPPFLFVIEFASPDEAKKFESELRAFLPKLDPRPTPSPSPSPGSQPDSTPAPSPTPTANPDSFARPQIKQTGALILVTERPISLRDFKPRGSRLLSENPNFALARNRFASESVFLYVDFKAIEKEEKEQRKKWEEAEQLREEQAAANPTPEPSPDPGIEEQITALPEDDLQLQPPRSQDADQPNEGTETGSTSEAQLAESFNAIVGPISMALFGGRAKFPEALGAALAFEGDSYIVRALVVNSPENRALPLPFMPQLASGPALTPSSPNILPGDVDLFVVLSLDYLQVYDGMARSFAEQPWVYVSTPVPPRRPLSPFSSLEEKVGINVKEELLPLLGNEIAFVLPKAPTNPATSNQAIPPDNEDRRSVRLPEVTPVIAVSIKDKDAVKRLIPKVFESMGLKGASVLAHTEKREDTELVSFANTFSYAFIGDFLLFTPDAALTRRVVDSYLSGQTLSSDGRFRNAIGWQSRQVQGQVYVGSDLVESYVFAGKEKSQNISLQANQPIEPLTYALSNEGLGPLHEVHIPRSLLMMVVAGISSKANESPIFTNESIAKNVLRTLAAAQATYRDTKGNGRYGSLDELIAAELLRKDLMERYGYKIDLSVLSNKFEVIATPIEYGKTGRRSFYIDESGILRGGDHAGGAATLSDKPIVE